MCDPPKFSPLFFHSITPFVRLSLYSLPVSVVCGKSFFAGVSHKIQNRYDGYGGVTMSRILAIGLPCLLWLALLVLVAKRHYRKNLYFFLVSASLLLGIWQLTQSQATNFLWEVLFCAVIVAALVAGLLISNEHDLIMAHYWHWLARVLVLATTWWWLAAIFLTR